MRKLIGLILFPFLILSFESKANEKFSVEIEALTLVMEQYKEDTESNIELDKNNKKPSYLAFKQDECNATVKICLLYTSPSPRDRYISRMPSSA